MVRPRRISLIVAVSRNGVIGGDGKIPWHLSSDLQRFKQLTSGHTIIMGRRTFRSLGRILPNRRHIVLSRDPDFRPAGAVVADSWEQALAQVKHDDEVFVIGGEEVYRVALPEADRIYLTRVPIDVSGDAYFPLAQVADWLVRSDEHHSAGPRDDCDHRFQVLERPAESNSLPMSTNPA